MGSPENWIVLTNIKFGGLFVSVNIPFPKCSTVVLLVVEGFFRHIPDVCHDMSVFLQGQNFGLST